MAISKKKNQTGRPSLFTPELGFEICTRMAEGESVRSICRDPKMPCRKTINNWLLKPELKEFLRQYELAENLRAETYFDEILDIANDSSNDYIEKKTKNGEIVRIANRANIQRARLKIDVLKWSLSKMLPNKFGNRVHTEHSGNVSVKTLLEQIIDDEEKATNDTA